MNDCPPTQPGLYFATHCKHRWRTVVEVSINGHGHTWAYLPKLSAFCDLNEFVDRSGPIGDVAMGTAYQDGGGI